MSKLQIIARALLTGLLLSLYTLLIITVSVTYSPKGQEVSDRIALNLASQRIFKLEAGSRETPRGIGPAIMGTGFEIKAKSGNVFTITNNHICDHSTNNLVTAIDELGNKKDLLIIKEYENEDLCLLEGSGNDGYDVAEELRIKESVHTEGHPAGYPLVLEKGMIFGLLPMDWMNPVPPGENKICTHTGYQEATEVPNLQALFGFGDPSGLTGGSPLMIMCHEHHLAAIHSNTRCFPGDSGSPLLNSLEEVVGVVYAIDTYGFTLSVSLDEIKKLLKDY